MKLETKAGLKAAAFLVTAIVVTILFFLNLETGVIVFCCIAGPALFYVLWLCLYEEILNNMRKKTDEDKPRYPMW